MRNYTDQCYTAEKLHSIACMQLRFLSVPARSKDAESSTSFCAENNTIWECRNASSRHEPSLNGSQEMSFLLLFVSKKENSYNASWALNNHPDATPVAAPITQLPNSFGVL